MRSATDAEIAIIKVGNCPLCRSENTDFVASGTFGGTDECLDCKAFWSTEIQRRDGNPVDCGKFEQKLNESDYEQFSSWYREQGFFKAYTVNEPEDHAVGEGLKRAFPDETGQP